MNIDQRVVGMEKVLDRIVLLPGQLIISKKEEIVWTLLGSCVSIVFHNPRKKISGICHAQLPHEGSKLNCKDHCPTPCGKEEKIQFKYVTCSFRYMLDYFHKLGIANDEIEVGLYGGASMFNLKQTLPAIGEKNIEIAKKMIKDNDLQLRQNDTGGNYSRTITHFSDTGITHLKVNN